jgi:hypothetical protein
MSLKLQHCFDLDLVAELLPCTQLKELTLTLCEFKTTPTPIKNDSFFPSLKKLTISSCDSDSSQLLELCIPSLTELRLCCSHFGICSITHLNWNSLPRLYPNLKVLSIRCPCICLKLEETRSIASELPWLEWIQLPLAMLRSLEEKLTAEELVAAFEELDIVLQFTERPPAKELLPACQN